MTYCLGLLMREGLVFVSDSRSNAGVDNITLVRKIRTFVVPGERVIVMLSAGNLATTQAITGLLTAAAGNGFVGQDIHLCLNMFDAAQLVGDKLRAQIARDAPHVQPYGDPNATFIVGGQIRGEGPRMFEIYSAGNFVEVTQRRPFAQVGETKYGKPILDRAFRYDTSLGEASKLALLSMDATVRSNLSVAAPVDLLPYPIDTFSAAGLRTFETSDPYWHALCDGYDAGLRELVHRLPGPTEAS
ncbi:MAG: peptidase [Myxococcota bacterium]